jgi:hypothetical protein
MILLPTRDLRRGACEEFHRSQKISLHFTKKRSKLIRGLCETGSVADEKKGKSLRD